MSEDDERPETYEPPFGFVWEDKTDDIVVWCTRCRREAYRTPYGGEHPIDWRALVDALAKAEVVHRCPPDAGKNPA